MEEHRLARALAAAGVGGAALAAGSLMLSVIYATTPDGSSPTAVLRPCFVPGCSDSPRAPGAAAGTAAAVSSDPSAAAASADPMAPSAPTGPSAGPKAPSGPPAATGAHLTALAPQTWANPVPTLQIGAPVVTMDSAGGSLLMVGSDGGVFPLGRAGFYGSLGDKPLHSRIAAAAVDAPTGGYWLASANGSVYSMNASFYGSLGHRPPPAPVSGMAATPAGDGYWLVSAAGGIYSFGGAKFYGSLPAHPGGPKIVGIVATPDGAGYWLVSNRGGVYAFGDAGYFGSAATHALGSPVVAMAATSSGLGYWLLSANGGVFNFGDASFEGSAAKSGHRGPMAAIVATPTDSGYWLADQAGQVFAYGDAVPVITTPRPAAQPQPQPQPQALALARAQALAQVRRTSAWVTASTTTTTTTGSAFPAAPVATNVVSYHGGVSGLDISQYQCNDIPTIPAAVAVVQVTGGGVNEAPNSCLASEVAWAGSNLSAYIYLDGVTQPVPPAALNGPHGSCQPTQVDCQAYNYGYNETAWYVGWARSVGIVPKLWWLDVERYSDWGPTADNALTVRGALDALSAMHLQSGIYSTATQWQEITGGMSVPGEAEWVPGAGTQSGAGYTATSFCAAPSGYTFGGGRLELVQYGYSGPFPGSYQGPTTYDQDYACS